MSVEVPAVDSPHSWEVERTELSHGFLARFIGHDVTDYEQVHDLRHRVRTVLEAVEIDTTTCDNAELIVSELAANAIEHGLQHTLAELDLTVSYPFDDGQAEVYISVINPTTEDASIESNPSMTDDENEAATSGRGGIITDALTGGDWGWRVEQLRSAEVPEEGKSLIVYAHLGATGLAGMPDDRRHAA